jgi:CHAT domain-containing protein/predicted negative regulator of RcsB-dependent stress response
LNALAIVEQDLGHWDSAAAHLTQAQTLLDTSFQASPPTSLQAQLWNTQGNFAFRQGQPQAALQFWTQASQLYQSLGDSEGYVLSEINQIHALKALGFYDRAGKQLDHIQETIAQLPVGSIKIHALQTLGDLLQGFGRSREVTALLDQTFDLAAQAGLKLLMAEIVLDQGVHAASLTARESTIEPLAVEKTLGYFTRVQDLNPPPLLQIEADLHQFRFLLSVNRPVQALEVWATLEPRLRALTPSRFSVSAQINVANSLMRARKSPATSSPLRPFRWPAVLEIAQLLKDAAEDAQALGDPRLQSFALGELAHLYESNQQYAEALDLTEQALGLAQTIRAEDAIALWQWQTGRIFTQQGNQDGALVAYKEAVKTLKHLRQDLVTTTAEVQFSFRESVEPVYRELTALLLDRLDQYPPEEQQIRLQQARETIESLQLAELENFFREACLEVQTKSIDSIDPHAAIVYPILLEDRVEVIVSLPDRSLQHHRYPISEARRNRILNDLRKAFNPALPASRVVPLGAKVYDWLIRPFEQTLETQEIKTIAFVLDSTLRTIPMGVLNDGEDFLIEKYNLAIAPGLQLLQPNASPSSDRFQDLKVFLGGLSDARNNFPALPNVQVEITDLATVVETPSVLLNEQFTQQNVAEKLRDYPASVVHLATHGQFSSDAEKTFLLAWDGQINVKTLDQVLKERLTATPLELLVLSACQTAQGDEQAILGLAGMAVRSGAQSTLGTLWPINDRSTAEWMVQFYQNLAAGQEKAEALRNAQLSFLNSPNYDHPYYWAPFILVGQWN